MEQTRLSRAACDANQRPAHSSTTPYSVLHSRVLGKAPPLTFDGCVSCGQGAHVPRWVDVLEAFAHKLGSTHGAPTA